jgi:hypothetical protein
LAGDHGIPISFSKSDFLHYHFSLCGIRFQCLTTIIIRYMRQVYK